MLFIWFFPVLVSLVYFLCDFLHGLRDLNLITLGELIFTALKDVFLIPNLWINQSISSLFSFETIK